MQKKLAALLLALVMLMSLLTGCGDVDAPASGEEEGADASESENSAQEEETGLTEVPQEARDNPVAYLTDGALNPEDVVMTVNGVDVTADTYVYWLSYQYTYAAYFYAQYGSALDLTQTVDDDGTTIAQSLADRSKAVAQMNALVRARAQEAGLTLSQEQEDSKADLEANYDDNTLLYYATDMETLEEAYSDSCLANNLKDHLFGAGGEMEPTQETLADYAQEHGTYTCRYILLATNDLEEDDEEGRQAQQELAEELLAQLQACAPEELEDKFIELQQEYNTADGNTERYTFDNDDSLVSGFREKVSELAVGELGLTGETDYGYFVLLRLENELDGLSEDYSTVTYDSLITQWMDEAEVTTSEAMDNLDVDAFYTKLVELQNALSNEMTAESEEEASDADADLETETQEDTTEPVG